MNDPFSVQHAVDEMSFQNKLFDSIKIYISFNFNEWRTDKITSKSVDRQLRNLFTNLCTSTQTVMENAPQNETELRKLLTCCEVILDFCWQSLNTGNWKSVPIEVRYVFGFTSFIKCLCLVLVNEELSLILQTCDLGLLMSPPFQNNILAKIASIVHNHKVTQNPFMPVCCDLKSNHAVCLKNEITRVKLLDICEFEKNYYIPQNPVIIENAIDFWPSIDKTSTRKWTLNYLLNVCGYRTVPVEIGSKYTDENWSQKLMTISKFTEDFIVNRKGTAYVAQHELFTQIEELAKDFSVPDYCCVSRNEDECEVAINAWFGPQGTVSPLHYDPNDNLLAQVFGSKYIRLYSSDSAKEMIYPHESTMLNNTSQVDVEHVDENKFPLFEKLEYKECVLNEGEMLFIPPKFWHFVKSLSPSFSISFWWK